jgi:hypothetical protein
MAKTDRESKNVTCVHVQGFYAVPDVTKPSSTMKGYLARPEQTTFGKLLMQNLPEMLVKGVVVVRAISYSRYCRGIIGIFSAKPGGSTAEWAGRNSRRVG